MNFNIDAEPELLLRRTALRKLTENFTVEEMERFFNSVSKLYDEKKIEAEANAEKEAERREKMKQIQELMKEVGLEPDILNEASNIKISAKRKKVKPKYRLIDESGKAHEWTGRGRVPVVFQDRLDKGCSKDDFLIVDSDSAA